MQKAEISAKLNAGANGNQLAKEYGVSKSTISLLRKRKFDEMLQSSKKRGTFNHQSAMSEDDNESIQSENENESVYDSDYDNYESDDKKSCKLSMVNQFKLYKPPSDTSVSQRNDTTDEYDDSDDESEEEEEDPNEICRKFCSACERLHIPVQKLRGLFELYSKLKNSGLIE